MNTLADLKRDCHLYEWSLKENSWFKEVPEFQKVWRKVGTVQSAKFALITHKESGDVLSWCDFPKAKELQIMPLGFDNYILSMKMDCGSDRPPHTMVYQLRRAN